MNLQYVFADISVPDHITNDVQRTSKRGNASRVEPDCWVPRQVHPAFLLTVEICGSTWFLPSH